MTGGIDSHAHVFTRALRLIATARYEPARDATPEQYLAQLDAHGVGGGVLVQPSFLGNDNTYLIDAIAAAPQRFRGIVVVARDADAATLDRLDEAGARGIRLNLIGAKPDVAGVASLELLREVARRGWSVEVQADGPDWPALLPDLLRSGARLVIDHFGRPSPALGTRCPGFRAILKAARDHEIWAKLSGPYRFNPQHAVSCAAALLDALGPGRLVWGSDWPWTQHPEITDYGATLAWLDEWVPDAAIRGRILRENPVRLYGFR
jgi:predicted TIM-barrel fold metal-dependent hydrolase